VAEAAQRLAPTAAQRRRLTPCRASPTRRRGACRGESGGPDLREGGLRTPLLTLGVTALSLNVDGRRGAVRAQGVDREGKPVLGFTFADGQPITWDALAAPLEWRKPVSTLVDLPVRLEFTTCRARLFALDVHRQRRRLLRSRSAGIAARVGRAPVRGRRPPPRTSLSA
jgi:hypothetical protein